MSNPILPPPPIPRFPQQFTDDQGEEEEEEQSSRSKVVLSEMQEVETRGNHHHHDTQKWNLKTEAEEHLQRLEDKLERLTSNSRVEQSQRTLGRTSDISEPDLSQLQDYSGDQCYDFDRNENEDDQGDEEAEGEAAGHEEEGRALLSIAEQSTEETKNGITDEDDDDGEADLSGNDEIERLNRRVHPFENMTTAQRISFSNSVRISGGIHTRPHRHRPPIETSSNFPRRSPSNERSNPHSHHREARPETAPSPLLVASVTSSSSNVNSPSRATSPSGRSSTTSLNVLVAPKPRRLSSSSHLSSSGYNPAFPYYYSASPGSQIPSRGSSPCSSIYAPLQPPSKHTPNPLFVRPSPRLLQRQQSTSGGGGSTTSGLSFQEYLREGYDQAFEESDDDDSDVVSGGGGRGRVPKSPGYRELVEQQRKQRAQWEERRRRRIQDKRRKLYQEGEIEGGGEGGERESKKNGDGAGFWKGVKRFFAVGTTMSSDATLNVINTNTFGTGVGRAGGSFGSPSVFRNSSRCLPTNVNYGSTSSSLSSSSPVLPPAPPPPKPRSILTSSRFPSSDSLSNSPLVNVNSEPPPPPPPPPRTPRTRSRSSQSTKPPHPPPAAVPDKTELYTRFGTPPFRYFNISFLLYKLENFFKAVRDMFSIALKGFEKQKEREERERLLRRRGRVPEEGGGYQAV
ncbi:hypothetical protein JCM5350_005938 [Sporobolomyces pararoseus]